MDTYGDLFKAWIHPTIDVVASHPAAKVCAAVVGFGLSNVLKVLQPQVMGMIFVFVLFDTLTGLLVAVKKKKVSSKRWYKSLVKLANYSMLVIIGGMTADIVLLSWLSEVFVMLILMTELISILENMSILQPGLIPKKIVDVLELLKY